MMVDKVFIPSRYSTDKVLDITAQLRDAGIGISGIRVSRSIRSFAQTLCPGDRVVFLSFDVFGSLIEMMASVRLFLDRGAMVHSVLEPEVSQGLTRQVVEDLLNALLCSMFQGGGVGLVNVSPEKLGDVYRVERLVRSMGMSLSGACRASGCSLNVYHYYERMAREKKGAGPCVVPAVCNKKITHH